MNDAPAPGKWIDGELPKNVRVGPDTIITGSLAFKRFHSVRDVGLVLGHGCTMDGTHFAVGTDGRIEIGECCYFTNTVLLCEVEIRVGNFVVIGWNAAIADTDFHPIGPAERIHDALACSPLGKGRPRPAVERRPVVIEDDVWIGPNALVLKGVRIATGAMIEAGAVVTRDVPPRARMLGNPAVVIGEV